MSFVIAKFEEQTLVYPDYIRDWVFAWAILQDYEFIDLNELDFACLNLEAIDKDQPYYRMTLDTESNSYDLLFTLKSFEKLLEHIDQVDLENQPTVGITSYKLVFIEMNDYMFVCCEDMYRGILQTLYSYKPKLKKDRTHVMVSDIKDMLAGDEE